MACERRPGSRTKLASIESNATPRQLDAGAAEHLPVVLDVVAGLRDRGVLEQRHQRREGEVVDRRQVPDRRRAPRARRRAGGGRTAGTRLRSGSRPARGRRARRRAARARRSRCRGPRAAPARSRSTSAGMASGSSRTTTSSAGWASMASQSAAVTSGVTVAPSGGRGDGALVRLELACLRDGSARGPCVGGWPLRFAQGDFLKDGCRGGWRARRPGRSAVPCPTVHRSPALPSSAPARRTPAR